MATTYTRDGREGSEIFTRAAIPRPFTKDIRDLVSEGVRDYDWKLVVTNRGHMTLVAPEPNQEQTINLSQTNNGGPTKRMRSAIQRYGTAADDPVAPAPAKAQVKLKDDIAKKADAAEERAKKQSFKEIQEERRRMRQMEAEEARAQELDDIISRGEERRAAAKEEDLKALLEVEGAAAEKASGPERWIVRQEPMIAHRGNSGDGTARGYLSPTTLEREWSDGDVEYMCRFDGCTEGPGGGPYVSEERRGPSSHWAVHVNAGEAEPASKMERDTAPIIIPGYDVAYTKGPYNPQAARVRALAQALKVAMEAGLDWDDLDGAAETLATEALTWAHEQSNAGTALAGEFEPLSAEEILRRIRNLLDNGEYMAQREEIAALKERIEQVEQMALAAEEAREQAESDLQAIHDLTRRGEAS